MTSFFDYFERFVLCISPVIIAWFGYQANRNEKQTKKYIEAQEELKRRNEELKEHEKQELQDHFDKLDESISSLTKQMTHLDKSISQISEIDKRIDGLVQMSNVNFEFCTSLSSVISSIGNALDSSDAIVSGTLHNDIAEHQKHSTELINRVCKIVY